MSEFVPTYAIGLFWLLVIVGFLWARHCAARLVGWLLSRYLSAHERTD